MLYPAPFPELPDGTVVVDADGVCRLVLGPRLLRFTFDGWTMPEVRPRVGTATVLTPPTSVLALRHGFRAQLRCLDADPAAGRSGAVPEPGP